MRLLIVEDEPKLLDSILQYLRKENFICDKAASFQEALDQIGTYTYDCIVVDIMLGDGNGLDVIKTLKLYKVDTGVIIISAKDSLDDKIKGLELGSDDYLTKPFHLAELNARIRSVLRRKMQQGFEIVEYGDIKMTVDKNEVELKGNITSFTPKEFELLLFFLTNKEKVVTKSSIADHLWQDEYSFGSYDFIYSHIKNLRKKLETNGCDYFHTIYGVGYKFQMI